MEYPHAKHPDFGIHATSQLPFISHPYFNKYLSFNTNCAPYIPVFPFYLSSFL